MKLNLKKLTTVLFAVGLLINPIFAFNKTNNNELTKIFRSTDALTKDKIKRICGELPVTFEINKGQVNDQVKFLSRGNGYTLFLTDTETVLSIKTGKGETKSIRMNLHNNQKSEIIGETELPGKSNYFIGKDSKKWRKNISSYSKVRYKDVYKGIDLLYYGNNGQIEYDFIATPGADVRNIKMEYAGVDKIFTNEKGELILKVGDQEIKQNKPFIYQEEEGHKVEIAGNYKVKEKKVGFSLGNYDSSKPLVIDPAWEYSTYLGGSGDDFGKGIKVDKFGTMYITGSTESPDFPTEKPIRDDKPETDVFVTKLSPSGQFYEYSTYLGGDGNDYGQGIALDQTGAAYVTGATGSINFPEQNAFQSSKLGGSDAFITKLSVDGALAYSTYLGGDDNDEGHGIAVDGRGAAYVAGVTSSIDFYQKNSSQGNQQDDDAFVTKFKPFTGGPEVEVEYSTYLGGERNDTANGIAVDNTGNASVVGSTQSDRFPVTLTAPQLVNKGGGDVFVTKFDSIGTRRYSTYLGGTSTDYGTAITLDTLGSIYITGITSSSDFFTINNSRTYQQSDDVFVAKFNSLGNLIYSTYLGGTGGDLGLGIAVDSIGTIYVTGKTSSTDFPTINPLQISKPGENAFVSRLDPEMDKIIFSTYMGGSGDDLGYALAVDSERKIYITGWTDSTEFHRENQKQSDQPGIDAFVSKINPCPGIKLPPSIPNGEQCVLYPAFTINATDGFGPYNFLIANPLEFPKGLTLSANGIISGTPTVSGTFTFTITATDVYKCQVSKKYTINIVSSITPCVPPS